MSKRIFSKSFSGYAIATGAVAVETGAVQSWLAQEDIEVIGAEINMVCEAPSQNDGYSSVEIELSQVGVLHQDGAILSGSASEGWNTSPAGIALTGCNVAVTFPPTMAVPVKEEGYLYINTLTVGKTAAVSAYHYAVIVWYTKKGSR